MTRLIFEPKVHLIAKTEFCPIALGDWAADHDLSDALDDDNTPLGKIAGGVNYEPGYPDSDPDLLVEFGGRFCYRSFKKGRGHEEYMANILDSGHGSVLEHANFTFALSGISRTLTHELVRHRAGTAISQESQRYVDAKDMRFVVPPLMIDSMKESEMNQKGYEDLHEFFINQYKALQENCQQAAEGYGFEGHMATKRANEAARSVLPGNSETRMVWTANGRALRHVMALRGNSAADLEIMRLATYLLPLAKSAAPQMFADLEIVESTYEGIPHMVASKYPKV